LYKKQKYIETSTVSEMSSSGTLDSMLLSFGIRDEVYIPIYSKTNMDLTVYLEILLKSDDPHEFFVKQRI